MQRLRECLDDVVYRTAEVEDVDACRQLVRESFYPFMPMYQHLGIDPSTVEDLPWVSAEIFQQGLTVVAETDGRIVGLLNSAIARPNDIGIDHDVLMRRSDSQTLGILFALDKLVDFFSLYNVKEYVNFFLLAVHHAYGRRGIGRRLMEMAMLQAARLGYSIMAGSTENFYSQRICETLGFDRVGAIAFKDYVDEKGERPFAGMNATVHKESVLFAKRLSAE